MSATGTAPCPRIILRAFLASLWLSATATSNVASRLDALVALASSCMGVTPTLYLSRWPAYIPDGFQGSVRLRAPVMSASFNRRLVTTCFPARSTTLLNADR
ncbi:hypothetical protein EXIGLDRAFT_844538 [Exidia glandulosa HHB12029]|uniref:Secreted protein n=1 Tax=Exidia glandulosa HHB12029 TaxID=1314781 RepID=A0A165BZF8_EXIGL|nr:hypothetical protein EXIGLDRAFT_844538 [Exidia glandulosa HHB12029]